MFENLFDLSVVRNKKQAVGFYFAYLALFVIVSFLLGGLAGIWITDTDIAKELGFKIGVTSSVILSGLLAALVVNKKDLWGGGSIALIVVVAAAALVGGGILGLIPVAYLTTRGRSLKKKEQKSEHTSMSHTTNESSTDASA